MEATLRPMSASQVLDRTFYIYRKHFILFVGIALVLPSLRLLASLAELAWLGKPPVMDPGQFDPGLFRALIGRLLLQVSAGTVVFFVGNALASSATAYAVSMVHLGRATTIVDSYRRVAPIFFRILWLTVRVFWLCSWPFIGSYVLIIVGGLLLPSLSKSSGGVGVGAMVLTLGAVLIGLAGVVGGGIWFFYAYCRYALSVPACTVENLRAGGAMRRSKFLSQGSLGRIFGVYILTAVMGFILGLVLELPVVATHNVFTMEGQRSMTLASHVWLQLAQFVGTALAGPIATVAMALLYYDQRVRKEAFDLQWMMQALPDTTPPPPPPPPPAPAAISLE